MFSVVFLLLHSSLIHALHCQIQPQNPVHCVIFLIFMRKWQDSFQEEGEMKLFCERGSAHVVKG